MSNKLIYNINEKMTGIGMMYYQFIVLLLEKLITAKLGLI